MKYNGGYKFRTLISMHFTTLESNKALVEEEKDEL